jgi:hypothetical protein
MEYKVIKEDHLSWLSNSVNEHLKKGWKPQGGIFYDSKNNAYLQAMIKERSFDPDFFTSGA